MNPERYGMLKVRASMAAYFAEQLERYLANLPLNVPGVGYAHGLIVNVREDLEKVQRLLRDNRSKMVTTTLGDMLEKLAESMDTIERKYDNG